jgi:GAF domain-containing protein
MPASSSGADLDLPSAAFSGVLQQLSAHDRPGHVPERGRSLVTDSDPLDPTEAFAELSRIKLSDTDLNGVLNKIADLAKRTIAGADEVSVTLVQGKKAHTAVFTGEMSVRMDESQYATGHGPCLDASASGETFSVPEMAVEHRWPDWAEIAADAGVNSSLSIGLPVQETVTGALNIYSAEPKAFDDDAVILAQTFAGYAAVALANAHLYATTAALAQQMQAAMESRSVIEQAKGIIMGDRRCTPDEAFQILTKLSQDTNRKLRDVAAALVAQASQSVGR